VQIRWRRREYRRRCFVAVLVLLIVVVVCAIGLLMLSGASPDTHVIFNTATAPSPVIPR
jgi:ABC-type transport system involved in cytochrome bd biosynthesis fused ATPase/permease subunit